MVNHFICSEFMQRLGIDCNACPRYGPPGAGDLFQNLMERQRSGYHGGSNHGLGRYDGPRHYLGRGGK